MNNTGSWLDPLIAIANTTPTENLAIVALVVVCLAAIRKHDK